MKRILLTFATLALLAILGQNAANAADPTERTTYEPRPARMSDARMKALLIGTWNYQDQTDTFTLDGKWLSADPKFPDEANKDQGYRWKIEKGQLIQIRPHPEASRPFTIVFLTKHECLIWVGHHEEGYWLWWR